MKTSTTSSCKSLPVVKLLALATVFSFLVAAQCCTVTPTPTVVDPADWSKRLKATDSALVADKATLLNLKVDFQYNFDEYRFKVGADSSTPCGTDTGYTPWTPKATRLQADISAIPDGKVKLCLLGRGKNNCNNIITQLPVQANFYRWKKDTTGPGAFSITAPTTTQTATTFPATWSAASDAAGYTASIHSAAGCQSASMLSQYAASSTSTNVTVSSAGNYYLCVSAADALGNKTNASNNSFPITVQTQPQETIIEDRITDRSCWAIGAQDLIFLHYISGNSNYPELASTITGNGKSIKKVSVLFGLVDKVNSSNCTATDWSRLDFGLTFFQNKADYISNPRSYTGRPGVYDSGPITPANNDPAASDYYRNPVAIDGLGCPIYKIDIDVAKLNVSLNTVANQESVVLLRPGILQSNSVYSYTYLGKNTCAGSIGNVEDLYVSLSGVNTGVPQSLKARGYANWQGVYKIVTN